MCAMPQSSRTMVTFRASCFQRAASVPLVAGKAKEAVAAARMKTSFMSYFILVYDLDMRSLGILILVVSAATAQPHYDLLVKGGHVIDAKNRIDDVRDVAIEGGRIARVAPKIDPSEARKVVDVAGLYVTPGLIDIHVHVFKRSNPPSGAQDESVNPDAFSFRSGVTTVVDAGSSGWKDFADFRDHIIKPARTR